MGSVFNGLFFLAHINSWTGFIWKTATQILNVSVLLSTDLCRSFK
jgi:hypothetical protein